MSASSPPLAASDGYRTVTDQMRRTVRVPAVAQRIVSLVPSQTELLFDLGLEAHVVGVTRYCVHPRRARDVCSNVGGTKRFDFEAIGRLSPDLIIGNKEENYRDGIERLEASHPVWMSDIENFEDALDMIGAIGDLTGTREPASRLRSEISTAWNAVPDFAGARAAYLIWDKPMMSVGTGTFIDAVLARLGFDNVYRGHDRYPVSSAAELQDLEPDVVMLSSEPFPYDESHRGAYSALVARAKVLLVDGEMFSWYGSRLRRAPAYFGALHRDVAE